MLQQGTVHRALVVDLDVRQGNGTAECHVERIVALHLRTIELAASTR